MVPNIHALIQDYLQQQTIVSLVNNADLRQTPDRFYKAALLPFIRRAGLHYYMMKPRAEHEDLPPPEFQICKGTRQHYMDGFGWRDMKEGVASEDRRELLVETALREGIEELGLQLINVVGVFDIGPHNFISASTNKTKQLWLYAVEVIDANDFLPLDEIEPTTQARSWVTPEAFTANGREDNKPILADVHKQLSARFK